MKLTLHLITLILTFSMSFAQVNPIDFESSGEGASWTWTVFENDTNPPLEIVTNPDPSGINTSATVAKFTALSAGMPFAGTESEHGEDIGTFTISSENAFVSILVWKSVISDVGIKFATPAGGSTGEIKVANKLTNQWERLTFDFTSVIGIPETIGVDQIIVFPDFRDRTEDTVVYFDDIRFGDSALGVEESSSNTLQVYPNPVNTVLTIEDIQQISRVQIHNILGQKVIDIKSDLGLLQIDMSLLTKGLYMATITQNNENQLLKIIKN